MVKEVRAAHILVKGEPKAKELMEKLKTGEDFSKLATENSLCPSKKEEETSAGSHGEKWQRNSKTPHSQGKKAQSSAR